MDGERECFRSAHQNREQLYHAGVPAPVPPAPPDAPGVLRADPLVEGEFPEREYLLRRRRVRKSVEAPGPAEGSAPPTAYMETPACRAVTCLHERRHRRAGLDESPADRASGPVRKSAACRAVFHRCGALNRAVDSWRSLQVAQFL